jgi:GntP family gluconate:H+ symporter
MLDSLIETVTNPLVILLIGLVTVIGMIIVLRLNAFIALITAAILVSLLSPGELAEKITRVATAFGTSAGKIGIVIALAAVIGKCLMDSGAADRIVRCFLQALGEKRSPEALMGASFVLAVPVFFDTVFYLMVPLARSLFRRTKKNYLLYILAIGAGGAVTHSMVPPTPGPLFVAAELGIDLGVMMLGGVLVGLPTAVVGLLACRTLNRLMDVPMRPYSDRPELAPLEEAKLPALWISLAPILLPVLMISARSATVAIADAERTPLIRAGDVADWPAFAAALHAGAAADRPDPARRVSELLTETTRQSLDQALRTGRFSPELQAQLQAELNKILTHRQFYREEDFAGIVLPPPAKGLLAGAVQALPTEAVQKFNSQASRDLLGLGVKKLDIAELERFNRLLLEAAFPQHLQKHIWDTPWRKAARLTTLFGDANLALLLAAVIAMALLVRQRGLTLAQLAKATEDALMSGGVIILITAAGGAFGAMLAAAGVGGAVQQIFASSGQDTGIALLLLGFGVAAILKTAQGSTTVAVITAAGMLAAMAGSPEQMTAMLGCHPVYLATAIASGGLVTSWMNDSGFWIVARMSVLTEVEALKSWTVLITILGFSGLVFTLLISRLLPML